MNATPLLLLLVVASTLEAQAPRVSSAGDPSVRPDTIYALAAQDSASYADRAYTYLLDDGIVRMEADGRGSRTYRQIVHVLNRAGAENWGELSFSYSPSREHLTVNWARVLRADGTVLADKPVHEQESLAEVAEQSPVYTDQHVVRLSLGAVAPGTIVDYSYTTEVTAPLMPGNFVSSWSTTTGEPVHRSRLILDLPSGMHPLIKEQNLRHPAVVSTHGGRRVYVWADQDVPRLDPEPFAARPNSLEVSVTALAPLTWADVARWYAALARDRYVVTPAIEARLPAVFAAARTADDSLRALHRWIAQDFRYVSLSLGIGGYQPRTPDAVVRDQYGDCKDKATLFVALARRMGLEAWPVLLSSSGDAEKDLPTPGQFDHMIAAVRRPGVPGYLFLDLTAGLTPVGSLPPAEQGSFALVVKDDGTGEQVTLPEDSVGANRSQVTLVGELTADGEFHGTWTRTAVGARAYGLRRAFLEPYSPTDRERLIRSIANEVVQGASGDSLVAFDGRDLSATPRLSLVLRGGRPLQSSGGTEIFTLPLDDYALPALAPELEARGPRRYPIDAEAVVGAYQSVSEVRVTLPEGWHARLPPAISASSAFGTYRAEYAQEGRVLTVRRTLIGARGVLPPSAIGELIAWLRAMSRDDVKFVVLEHA